MNCTTCNTPLEMNARFCPKCGQPTSVASANANPSPQYQASQPQAMDGSSTVPPTYMQIPQKNEAPTVPPTYLPRPQQGQPSPDPWLQPQSAPQGQPSYYRPGDPQPGTFRSAETARPRRRGRGCLSKSLITLVVLVLLIAGGWFLALRPYLNNLARTRLDTVLGNAVDNIPPAVGLLPGGEHIPIRENLVNNLLVLAAPPDNIVQSPRVHFTPTQLRLDFQVYGFSCAVTGVPQVSQGRVVFTNVNIEGIAALILSPDDIMSIVNKHLADAQAKLNHPMASIQLKDQELDLVVGTGFLTPTGGLPGGIPTAIPTGFPTGIPTGLPTGIPTLPLP